MTNDNPYVDETNTPSLWHRMHSKFLDNSEKRAFLFACLVFPALLVWVAWFSTGLLTANRHAFSGCLGDPGTIALWMDAFGYYLAVSAKAVFFSIFFTAFSGVVYFVLDSCVSNMLGFCKGTAELCMYIYKDVTTQKPKRPVITTYDLDVYARSLRTRLQDRLLSVIAWVIQRMWFMVLVNFLGSCLAAGIMYVISAPQVCYAQSTLGYSIGIYCVLFIGLMFVPIQVVLSMSFSDYRKHRDLRERMSFHVASVFTRAHMIDNTLLLSHVPEPQATNDWHKIDALVVIRADSDVVVVRWHEAHRTSRIPSNECFADLYIRLDAWSNELTYTKDDGSYTHIKVPDPIHVNVRELTTEQLFDVARRFQASVDVQHSEFLARKKECDTDDEES